jgi:DNA-directed RNA polymerase specialized sigma24 family protein
VTASARLAGVLQYMRALSGTTGSEDCSDGELLRQIVARRDETAFAALLGRHGQLVFEACRQVLGDEQDAEDAFQATFVVLVRKAASLRARELLGNWLYGVAYRTAMQARTMNARRRAREGRASIKANYSSETSEKVRAHKGGAHKGDRGAQRGRTKGAHKGGRTKGTA